MTMMIDDEDDDDDDDDDDNDDDDYGDEDDHSKWLKFICHDDTRYCENMEIIFWCMVLKRNVQFWTYYTTLLKVNYRRISPSPLLSLSIAPSGSENSETPKMNEVISSYILHRA